MTTTGSSSAAVWLKNFSTLKDTERNQTNNITSIGKKIGLWGFPALMQGKFSLKLSAMPRVLTK